MDDLKEKQTRKTWKVQETSQNQSVLTAPDKIANVIKITRLMD